MPILLVKVGKALRRWVLGLSGSTFRSGGSRSGKEVSGYRGQRPHGRNGRWAMRGLCEKGEASLTILALTSLSFMEG